MATLRELIIKISANSRSFQSEIARASRMGQDYYRTMQNGGRQSAAASREMRRALAEVTDQINTAKSSALSMAGAFAGVFATGHLISLADEWNSVNARLKQATQSSDDFQASQRELMAISQRTGTAFSDNASLFARSAASMREYGYSSEEVLKVTEAISTGLKLSGASTAEASSVITQFSQALAQGVLRGEEFNAVNENGDRVIRALAAGMGVARKDLKAMADDGKLTADKVVPALISQLGALRDEYAAMPDTVSSSATKVENAFMAWVGGANEAGGVTKTLSGVLSDFCSAMRCMPVWNGQTLTFVQDRPSDKVWTYNRSNVVMPDDGAPFRYSFSALKDRHNAVEVNWIDPDNGWETATELVEDTQAIARYGRNVTKMDAFGCTSRGQAHRAGLWLIKTELLETQTVDFSVGAEGLRHVPGDVIEICDDDYAGISTGGRVLAVNSQTRTLTLDREITLPSSGTTLISLVDGSGNPVSVEVQSVTDGVKVKVSRVPDGVAGYSVWGLKLPTLRQRLFR